MNTRDYKQFVAGSVYHIFNRGVAKINIFHEHSDLTSFFDRLMENISPSVSKTYVSEYGYKRKVLPAKSFDLICYCLMPNHFHLVIQQKRDVPISKLIHKVCTGYVKYFNKKYNRIGGLFQDQFKAVKVDSDMQLMWLLEYVHMNPLKIDPEAETMCCREDAHLKL